MKKEIKLEDLLELIDNVQESILELTLEVKTLKKRISKLELLNSDNMVGVQTPLPPWTTTCTSDKIYM